MHAIQTHGALTHQIDSLSPGMIASVRLPFFTVARADWLRRTSSGKLHSRRLSAALIFKVRSQNSIPRR